MLLPAVGPGSQQLGDHRQTFIGALGHTAVSHPSWKSLDMWLWKPMDGQYIAAISWEHYPKSDEQFGVSM